MSISPILAVAGIQATARIMESGIASLQETFRSLLQPNPRETESPDTHRQGLAGAPPAASSDSSIAQWVKQQAAMGRLQQLSQRISQVLQRAGLAFESPIELAWADGKLSVNATGHSLPTQVESHLLADPTVADSIGQVANLLSDPPEPLRVQFLPDGTVLSPQLLAPSSFGPTNHFTLSEKA